MAVPGPSFSASGTCFPTLVYLNPKGPLSEQLWQLSRNQAMVGISGARGAKLLGVPRLETVGTLEVLATK